MSPDLRWCHKSFDIFKKSLRRADFFAFRHCRCIYKDKNAHNPWNWSLQSPLAPPSCDALTSRCCTGAISRSVTQTSELKFLWEKTQFVPQSYSWAHNTCKHVWLATLQNPRYQNWEFQFLCSYFSVAWVSEGDQHCATRMLISMWN